MYIQAVKAPLCLVLATLFWSGNFVVGQAAVASMTPLDLTFWRWTLAAVPLLILAHFIESRTGARCCAAGPCFCC